MNFQEEVRRYEGRVREYEDNTAAWEVMRQNDEATYRAAYRGYEEELREHLTRIAALELTTPTEQITDTTPEPPQTFTAQKSKEEGDRCDVNTMKEDNMDEKHTGTNQGKRGAQHNQTA
eukprot:1780525-Heterocapsa_arctica.AAC.1